MNDLAKASLRRDRGAIEQVLKDTGVELRGRACRCPFHDDQHASAGIYEAPGGEWRFKCHPCGINEDVIGLRARLENKDPGDVLKDLTPAEPPRPKPSAHKVRVFPTVEALLASVAHWTSIEAHYAYVNPTTLTPDLITIRCRDSEGKKSFIQASPADGGGFVQKAAPKPWPLYNRTRLAGADVVVVVEGEKCVHVLHDAGWVATTSPAGAGKAAYADWQPLAGKTVYLWPDHDDAGLAHMREVAQILTRLGCTVFWIDPSAYDLGPKEDVVDFLEKFGGDTPASRHNAVGSVIDTATPSGPSAAVRRLIQNTVSGQRRVVPLPWPGLTALTNLTLPGSVVVVGGDPAASKSFWLTQAGGYWLDLDVQFAIYQLEADEEGSHLLRALVQRSGRVDLLDPVWMRDHGAEALAIEADHRQFLDRFGACLTVPPAAPPRLDELADWVRDRAKDGCRVIAVDPVTAAETSDKPWADDKRFILSGQKLMRDFGASLLLVTHPKKGTKPGVPGMDDLAGGAAYARFTQTVLWIRAFEPRKSVTCRTACADTTIEINRSVRIAKARLGRGTGLEVGYTFGGGMRFAEQGIIIKKPKLEDPES